MTERPGGSDVSLTETTARPLSPNSTPKPGDKFVLDGFKWFSSATDGDVALALARTGGKGSKGLSLFLIRLRDEQGRTNGVFVHRLKKKFGTKVRGASSCSPSTRLMRIGRAGPPNRRTVHRRRNRRTRRSPQQRRQNHLFSPKHHASPLVNLLPLVPHARAAARQGFRGGEAYRGRFGREVERQRDAYEYDCRVGDRPSCGSAAIVRDDLVAGKDGDGQGECGREGATEVAHARRQGVRGRFDHERVAEVDGGTGRAGLHG